MGRLHLPLGRAQVVQFGLWLLFLTFLIGALLYAITHHREPAFLPGFFGNLLATLIGLIGGVPVALWIWQWQQRVTGRADQAERDRHASERGQRVLSLIREELALDQQRLAQRYRPASDQPADQRSTHIIYSAEGARVRDVNLPLLDDIVWATLSDSGELQWIQIPELLALIARAYATIRVIIMLERQYFEMEYGPGKAIHPPIHYGLYPVLAHCDTVANITINEAINSIDEQLHVDTVA